MLMSYVVPSFHELIRSSSSYIYREKLIEKIKNIHFVLFDKHLDLDIPDLSNYSDSELEQYCAEKSTKIDELNYIYAVKSIKLTDLKNDMISLMMK